SSRRCPSFAILPAWTAAALASAAGAGAAPSRPAARLEVVREPGAESCDGQAEVQRAVAERLGYDPFDVAMRDATRMRVLHCGGQRQEEDTIAAFPPRGPSVASAALPRRATAVCGSRSTRGGVKPYDGFPFGVVYEAHRIGLGAEVAFKVLEPTR